MDKMDNKKNINPNYSLDDFGLYLKNELESSGIQEIKEDSELESSSINNTKQDSNALKKGQHSIAHKCDCDNAGVKIDEKEALIPLESPKQSDVSILFIAYGILFFIVLVFMPQIYLANNIYYASKNISYLKSQKEALKDENAELQQRLESLKFNFLTLEIEEIK